MSGRASQKLIFRIFEDRRPDDATFRPDETPADQNLNLDLKERIKGGLRYIIRDFYCCEGGRFGEQKRGFKRPKGKKKKKAQGRRNPLLTPLETMEAMKRPCMKLPPFMRS